MQSIKGVCINVLLLVLLVATAESKEYPYSTLIRSGEPSDAKYPFGTGVGASGEKILTNVLSGEDYGSWDPTAADNATEVVVSNNPDFFSILDAPDGGLIGFVHFESPNPSQIYALGLDQDKTSGKLSVSSVEPVDLSEWGGGWIFCAGSVTPWGVHIGGEEYEPNAAALEKAACLFESECGDDSLQALDGGGFGSTVQMLRYFNVYAKENETTIDEVRSVFNPYNYGYGVTVEPSSKTSGKATKWYTTGRLSQELVYVMPNNKTLYVTDDGTNVGFFRVELDTPGDLSSGTMYAAKLDQKSAENGGTFDLSWVELGSATQEELQTKLKSGLVFSDLFNSTSPLDDGTCPDGFVSVNQGGRGQECLLIVEGQENYAAFFEPRRYGAYLGATTEASKWEGFVYDPITKKAYTSISDVRYGMEDNQKKGEDDPSYDVGGPNAIKLPYNPCGCVYELDFDDNYVATSFNAALCGKPSDADENNSCDLEGISNPDNIARIGKYILIGEDTDGHQNDAVWAWVPETGELTRIATTPFGSETTGINLNMDRGNFNYLTAVTQHPYGETDIDQVDKSVNPYSEGPEGYVGYWPLPSSVDLNDISFNDVAVPKTQEEKSQLNVGSIVEGKKSGESSPATTPEEVSTSESATPTETSDTTPNETPTPSSSVSPRDVGAVMTALLIVSTFLSF